MKKSFYSFPFSFIIVTYEVMLCQIIQIKKSMNCTMWIHLYIQIKTKKINRRDRKKRNQQKKS